MPICNRVNDKAIITSVERLVDPLDNAINEKCSRIKAAFAAHVNQYSLPYYIISSHVTRHISGSHRIWFERKKTISLPRHLVIMQY